MLQHFHVGDAVKLTQANFLFHFVDGFHSDFSRSICALVKNAR